MRKLEYKCKNCLCYVCTREYCAYKKDLLIGRCLNCGLKDLNSLLVCDRFVHKRLKRQRYKFKKSSQSHKEEILFKLDFLIKALGHEVPYYSTGTYYVMREEYHVYKGTKKECEKFIVDRGGVLQSKKLYLRKGIIDFYKDV